MIDIAILIYYNVVILLFLRISIITLSLFYLIKINQSLFTQTTLEIDDDFDNIITLIV